MAEIQFKFKELAQESADTAMKAQLELLGQKMDVLKEYMQYQNNREERASREMIERNKLQVEQMNLAEGAMIHPQATPIAEQFVRNWPSFIGPPPSGGRII